MPVSGHQQVSDTLEELEVFASVLGRKLGVETADKGDRVAAKFFDVRFQDGVRGDFQEGHVFSAKFLYDLVKSGTKEHWLANFIPAVLNVQIPLEPFTVDSGHDLSSRLVGGGEGTLNEVLEDALLSLRERGVEGAGNPELGSEDLVGGVSGNLDHKVDEFVLTSNSDNLGRVDTSDPEATVDSGTSENLLDHELRLLDTDTQSDHSAVALGLGHGRSMTDGNADSGLTVVVARSVAHSDLADGVADRGSAGHERRRHGSSILGLRPCTS